YVERAIQEAMERGEFDNLPGRGKPLDLRENPYAGDWELAYKIIKDAGFTLEWIELRQEILQGRQECARFLQDSLQEKRRTVERYERVANRYREQAAELNKKVERYNLIVPIVNLQLSKLDVEEELRRFREAWCRPETTPWR
ncbi:MAG: DnaJ family domain-containing protein, partial [Anaerolineae bacterium]